LWPFGIFRGYLEYFSSLGMVHQKNFVNVF
jgi:hypothetical protein